MAPTIATHPGGFHADDVFAIATLQLALGEVEVIRTRDAATQDAADIRVDVGGRSDAAQGDFDHHQRGGAGERENGVRYASFGLVWRAYGLQLTGGDEGAFTAIDERLVQGVDANDTGQEITINAIPRVSLMSVSGLIAALNPAWDEVGVDEDARFAEAVAFARAILQRELDGAAAFGRARDLVLAAIAAAEDPRIVELPRNLPWTETVTTQAPEALYVLYPKADGWAVQAVRASVDSFANRKSFPKEWGGHTDAELQQITGVPDAVFAHTAGFYASAASRAGAYALARLAIEA